MESEFVSPRNPWKRCLDQLRCSLTQSDLRHWLIGFRHRKLRASDVFLASYPKSGNTWLRHLLTYVATQEPTPWRGGINRISDLVGRHDVLPEVAANQGRLIKTHEPFRDDYRRAVLLVRDGRDVAVSEYFFQLAYSRHAYRYKNSFALFLDLFLKGKTNGYRSWSTNVNSWLDASERSSSDILVLPFESLRSDTLGSLRKVTDHIGFEASDQLLNAAIEDCSVTSMKQKETEYWKSKGESSRNFVRGGKSGGWKNHFTNQLEESFWEEAGATMERLGYQREPISSVAKATEKFEREKTIVDPNA